MISVFNVCHESQKPKEPKSFDKSKLQSLMTMQCNTFLRNQTIIGTFPCPVDGDPYAGLCDDSLLVLPPPRHLSLDRISQWRRGRGWCCYHGLLYRGGGRVGRLAGLSIGCLVSWIMGRLVGSSAICWLVGR